MGFEIFFQCFAGGQSAGIPRATLRELFPVVEQESDRDHWRIRYGPEDSSTIGVTPDESDAELISAFYIDRPCGAAHLWEAVLSVLRMGSVMLFFPGEGPVLVGSERAVADLPPEVIETMGPPRCVKSTQEILDAIRGA
jgi:hypothetical protein